MILSVWGVVEGATDVVGGIRERTTVSPENAYVISASLGTSARNTRQATSKIRATHTELYYNLYTVYTVNCMSRELIIFRKTFHYDEYNFLFV